MTKPIYGGKNPKNADALLAAGEITQQQYDEMKKNAKKGKKRDKKKSIFDLLKGD